MGEWFVDALRGLIDPTQATVLAGLIVANLFTGVFGAMLSGTFDLARLGDFWKRAATVFIAYLAVGIVARVMTDWEALQTTMWAFLIAFMVKKIIDGLKEMGLPIPDIVSGVNGLVNTPGTLLKGSKKKK